MGIVDRPPGGEDETPSPALWGPLIVYSLLRIALVAALTALLALFMPLIVALMFAIIVQLPLAWIVFARPRRRVNEAIAAASARRRAERARLQSALAGDTGPSDPEENRG